MKLSELTERECAFCGDTFMPRHPKQLYCTADCRFRQARQVAHDQRVAAREAVAAET